MRMGHDMNLVIDGLPVTATEADISALFSACGTVTAIEIVNGTAGTPLGVARVTMATVKEGQLAIATYHRRRFHDHTLLVFEDTVANRREELWNAHISKRP